MNAGLHVEIDRLGSATHTLVQGLRLDVPAGEILTLMGPSGCGKSSVLAAMAGTLASASGVMVSTKSRLTMHERLTFRKRPGSRRFSKLVMGRRTRNWRPRLTMAVYLASSNIEPIKA